MYVTLFRGCRLERLSILENRVQCLFYFCEAHRPRARKGEHSAAHEWLTRAPRLPDPEIAVSRDCFGEDHIQGLCGVLDGEPHFQEPHGGLGSKRHRVLLRLRDTSQKEVHTPHSVERCVRGGQLEDLLYRQVQVVSRTGVMLCELFTGRKGVEVRDTTIIKHLV